MCITDKAKETSSCADLFRYGATSVCLERGVFALRLGASVPLIRLPRCYYYTTCKWCMESHLSSDAGVLLALVPWPPCAVCAACVAAVRAREPGSVCALPPGLPVPPVAWAVVSALPCSLVYGPAMPALWPGLVRGPCILASYKPLLYGLFCGPVFRALYGPLKKALFSPGFFGYVFPRFFFGLYFCLKISGQIFRVIKAGFFRGYFSGENFPDIFSGFYFPAFFLA